jgi:hypothetical protein
VLRTASGAKNLGSGHIHAIKIWAATCSNLREYLPKFLNLNAFRMEIFNLEVNREVEDYRPNSNQQKVLR